MADHVQIMAPMVEQHASAVDQVGDAMELARSAVRDVTMDTRAYGQLCQFLPGILSPVFGLGLDALHSAIDVLHETAANLRTTAADVSAADTAASQRILRSATTPTSPAIELPL